MDNDHLISPPIDQHWDDAQESVADMSDEQILTALKRRNALSSHMETLRLSLAEIIYWERKDGLV